MKLRILFLTVLGVISSSVCMEDGNNNSTAVTMPEDQNDPELNAALALSLQTSSNSNSTSNDNDQIQNSTPCLLYRLPKEMLVLIGAALALDGEKMLMADRLADFLCVNKKFYALRKSIIEEIARRENVHPIIAACMFNVNSELNALKKENLEKVHTISQQFVEKMANKENACWRAIAGSHNIVPALETYLKENPEFANKKFSDGTTPLSSAAAHGALGIVKLLLENKANVDDDIQLYNTEWPILSEVINNLRLKKYYYNKGSIISPDLELLCLKMVMLFVKHGAAVNKPCTGNYITSLVQASRSNSVHIAKFLIDHGADRAIRTTYSQNAFDFAHSEEMKKLLSTYYPKKSKD